MSDSPAPRARRGPVAALLALFSSVKLGIALLSLLFVYCSIGSAGILYPTSLNVFDGANWAHAQLRQWRPYEMTEFEWFHWWPFKLHASPCSASTSSSTTLQRIPLRRGQLLGVWMVHSGIITLDDRQRLVLHHEDRG